MDSKKADLKQLLRELSVRTGNFVLSSGKSSTFYVDARLTTMSPRGMVLIGQLGLHTIRQRGWDAESIGGLTLGADPVSFAISYTSAADASPLRAFTVRKEAKQHGTGRLIEGPFKSGDKVVVIEDVITTGKSALQAIDSIVSMNGTILGVLSVVDREDGGREAIESRGYPVSSLFSISELLS